MGWLSNIMNNMQRKRELRESEEDYEKAIEEYEGKEYTKKDVRSALDAMKDFKYNRYLEKYKDQGLLFKEANKKARQKANEEMAKVSLKDLKGIASREATDIKQNIELTTASRRLKKKKPAMKILKKSKIKKKPIKKKGKKKR